MDVSQYLEIFIDETNEHLQNLSDCIMTLEKEPDNSDTINEVFRAAHSLKGMAGTMGFKRMQRLTHDMEDVFQNVFLKYMLYKGSFENEEHEKAWLVRVTVNACGDWLRSLSRRRWIPLESLLEEGDAPDDASREVMEAVLQLPEKYRRVIYLFYYEGYSAVEIAGILGKKENTVYTWLSRARAMLREKLGGEWA